MRSDIQLGFASKKNSANNSLNVSLNSGDREIRVSEVSGFIDVVWDPINPQTMYNIPNQMMPVATQKYSARAIITNIASNYSYTPGSIILALSTVMSLRDDDNWVQTFRPNHINSKEIDMSDIGALNIEANLTNAEGGYGMRIDTKADDFKLEKLGMLVGSLIKRGLIVSLDCPIGGPQAWYLSFLAAAEAGSNNAYNMIYDSINRLTNGNFEKHFPHGSAMFTDTQNQVHMGTWVDKNGVKRDLRDFDHIAVCNLIGDRNPQLIREFSDTFLRTQYPLMQRLAARKKMIESLSNESAVFTGKAQRLTFTAALMDAVTRSIRETNLNVRINTPLSSSDFNNQRGVASFSNAALIAPGQSFMNNSNGFTNNFNQIQGYGGFRW